MSENENSLNKNDSFNSKDTTMIWIKIVFVPPIPALLGNINFKLVLDTFNFYVIPKSGVQSCLWFLPRHVVCMNWTFRMEVVSCCVPSSSDLEISGSDQKLKSQFSYKMVITHWFKMRNFQGKLFLMIECQCKWFLHATRLLRPHRSL